MSDDSVQTSQWLLSTLIQSWGNAAIESQVYREIAEADSELMERAAMILASPVFVERQRQTDALRNQVLQAVASGDSETIAALLGRLSALLGPTPENSQEVA